MLELAGSFYPNQKGLALIFFASPFLFYSDEHQALIVSILRDKIVLVISAAMAGMTRRGKIYRHCPHPKGTVSKILFKKGM